MKQSIRQQIQMKTEDTTGLNTLPSMAILTRQVHERSLPE
jgi:hypothetical protein